MIFHALKWNWQNNNGERYYTYYYFNGSKVVNSWDWWETQIFFIFFNLFFFSNIEPDTCCRQHSRLIATWSDTWNPSTIIESTQRVIGKKNTPQSPWGILTLIFIHYMPDHVSESWLKIKTLVLFSGGWLRVASKSKFCGAGNLEKISGKWTIFRFWLTVGLTSDPVRCCFLGTTENIIAATAATTASTTYWVGLREGPIFVENGHPYSGIQWPSEDSWNEILKIGPISDFQMNQDRPDFKYLESWILVPSEMVLAQTWAAVMVSGSYGDRCRGVLKVIERVHGDMRKGYTSAWLYLTHFQRKPWGLIVSSHHRSEHQSSAVF